MIEKGSLVQSNKGHDFGRTYLVVDTCSPFAMCVDGDKRVLQNPKKKRIKHLIDLFIQDENITNKLNANKLHDFEVTTYIKNNRSIMHKN